MSQFALQDADWINPLMVRYFRTRLRSKVFFGIILGMVAAMVLMVIAVTFASLEGRHAAVRIAHFFSFWTAAPLFLLPWLALDAFRKEVDERTLEVLLITPLSRSKISWGAWLTFFAMAVLWEAVLFPVRVLFFFTHGEDIVLRLAASLSTLAMLAPLLKLGLWVGLMNGWLKRIVVGVLWLIGYGVSLGITFGIAAGIGGDNSPIIFSLVLLIHSALCTGFTHFLVCDGLTLKTHADMYSAIRTQTYF